ncbi:hypothetical protein H5410_050404 [Solanum commersonii]|uniref:DUF4283 domain-containing protein n=1 Tax=Solanum commersonii TaxID=4109 RepID=A0A9J5WVE5_SOLCO|nr:hypothetical protein H5410_050404 [Solanum commersonii]
MEFNQLRNVNLGLVGILAQPLRPLPTLHLWKLANQLCPLTITNLYANTLTPPIQKTKWLPLKPITYLHGEPKIAWEEEEVEQMIINGKLHYVVIGKFSYGWPEIQDLRRLIQKQCELKWKVNIGLLRLYILIRASLLQDCVNLLSKPQFYITHNYWLDPMRILKWKSNFDLEEDTTTAIVWISLSTLPPNFLGKEPVFSMAATTVGKPLHVDMITLNKTHPSCTRVKVELDMLGEFPKRINVGMRKKSRKVLERWVTIKYDYVPKYFKTSKLQGHN